MLWDTKKLHKPSRNKREGGRQAKDSGKLRDNEGARCEENGQSKRGEMGGKVEKTTPNCEWRQGRNGGGKAMGRV